MLRIIFGAIAGFIIWSIIWVGTDTISVVLSPNWYGKNITEFQTAVDRGEGFTVSASMIIFALILSFICSVISGFAAAWIAQENTESTLLLGILLLITGIIVEVSYWNYFPLWYHLPFLLMLIPMAIIGGRLKRQRPIRRF